MSGFQLFIARFGWLGIFRLLFYPITALVATPLQLVRSIWNCRVLLNGKWSHYPHFDLVQSLNTLFYWTRARNFHERGRAGYAPYLGLGEYPLSRGFHYSLTSLFAYWTAPVVVLLVGMCCWWASHLIWLPQAESMVLGITMMLAVISTGFYAQLFSGQNYNVVGWAFFPLVLAGVYTGNPWLAATALILTSLGGITTFIIGVAFAGYQGVFMADWLMLPAIIPGAIKILTQFSPLFSASRDVRNKIMGNVLKAIGFTAQKAQYKRQLTKLRFDPYVVYNLLLFFQFVGCYYWLHDTVHPSLVVAALVLITNTYLFRFADPQSMFMMTASVSTMLMCQSQAWLLLISYWIQLSPLPLFAGLHYHRKTLDIVPVFAPFEVSRYLNQTKALLEPVPEDSRLLFAFKNPEGVYEKLFDGYRHLMQLAAYVAEENRILMLPEWWSVFELNYEGAPEIWGTEPEQVQANMDHWEAGFVLVYQEHDGPLDPKWAAHGFRQHGTFDWAEFKADFAYHKKYKDLSLKWFLLEKPAANQQSSEEL